MTEFFNMKFLSRLYDFKAILIISSVLGLCNLLTIQSIIGVFLTIMELSWVIYLILYKRMQDALIWHLIFIILSVSSQGASVITDGQTSLYNYAELKFIGPVRFSYFITILIWLISKGKREGYNGNLLYKSLKIFVFIAIIGDIIGIVGLTLMQYYSIDSFITYNVYIWIVIVTIDTILKNNHIYLIKLVYNISPPILCGGVFASLFGLLLGISTSYGGHEDLPMTLDIVYYCPLLLLSILFIRQHYLCVIYSIIGFFILVFLGAAGGKNVFTIAIALIWLGINIFKANKDKYVGRRIKYLRIVVVSLFIGIASYVPKVMSDGDSMIGYKIGSAISIFTGDIDDVSRSPAIRIAETANIFYNNRDNILALLFGRGYGGYFTDELGLFVGLEVWKGGWDVKIVSSGKYPTAHDTFAVVPLCNGIVGLFLILYLAWVYIARIKFNYLNFAAIPWLLFTFYFSTLCAITGIFFLIGGQYNLKKTAV